MTELYPNINDEIRSLAETAWTVAKVQKTPLDAAQFLDNVIRYYGHELTIEETEFLQFYFDVQMEMMKE